MNNLQPKYQPTKDDSSLNAIDGSVFNSRIEEVIGCDDKHGRLAARKTIEDYQSALQKALGSERGCAEELDDNGLTEHFVNGAYIRQLFIPKGITIVSRLWKNDRFWIITEGSAVVITEAGKQHIKAPYYGMAPYGSKVALYAFEDTMWFAITGSKAKDSDSAEKDVFVEDYKDFEYPWDSLENRGEL